MDYEFNIHFQIVDIDRKWVIFLVIVVLLREKYLKMTLAAKFN